MEGPSVRNVMKRRCGSTYVLVLGTAMLVTVIGLSTLLVTRIEARSSRTTNDMAEARLYAQSAIDMGLFWIKQDADWRTTYGEGAWATDQVIGSGTFTLIANDLGSEADIATAAPGDSVKLTGIGMKGDARHKTEVTLEANLDTPFTCLEVSLHAGTDLVFDWADAIGTQIISANNLIEAIGTCTINPASESVNGFVGTITPGPTTTPITPRTMPDPATVFDYYIANGTTIDISAMPKAGGKPVIDDVLISPANNPFPPYNTNGQGIYIFNCAGQDIYMQECRIFGTLVLLNPGSGSALGRSNAVNWEPAVPNYPALLVSGNMKISMSTGNVSESSGTGSYNPPGAPYEGVVDTDTDDTYPSVIKGLVYVSGNMTISNNATFDGVVVVGGSLDCQDDTSFSYQPTFLTNPPPGFGTASTGVMTITPGSWKQAVD